MNMNEIIKDLKILNLIPKTKTIKKHRAWSWLLDIQKYRLRGLIMYYDEIYNTNLNQTVGYTREHPCTAEETIKIMANNIPIYIAKRGDCYFYNISYNTKYLSKLIKDIYNKGITRNELFYNVLKDYYFTIDIKKFLKEYDKYYKINSFNILDFIDKFNNSTITIMEYNIKYSNTYYKFGRRFRNWYNPVFERIKMNNKPVKSLKRGFKTIFKYDGTKYYLPDVNQLVLGIGRYKFLLINLNDDMGFYIKNILIKDKLNNVKKD